MFTIYLLSAIPLQMILSYIFLEINCQIYMLTFSRAKVWKRNYMLFSNYQPNTRLHFFLSGSVCKPYHRFPILAIIIYKQCKTREKLSSLNYLGKCRECEKHLYLLKFNGKEFHTMVWHIIEFIDQISWKYFRVIYIYIRRHIWNK